MSEAIYWVLSNPALILYILAMLIVFFRMWGRGELDNPRVRNDLILAYFLLITVGVNGIYNFFMHAFFGANIAAFIGWPQSPFQMEVAMANLALGVLGILAFRANFGFRLATVIGLSCFMLGAAVTHVLSYMSIGNTQPGNTGSVFFTDILIPLTLIVLTARQHRLTRAHVLGQDKMV